MVTLTRPDGNWVGDLDISRRSLALALAGGYAVAAFSAEAKPVTTDAKGLTTGMVEIPAGDRNIPAYLARPEGEGRHAAVLVYSEIFGVHEWVKDVCRRLAHAGYVALAPNFFARHGDPAKLTDMEQIRGIVVQAGDQQVTADTAAALKFLKGGPFADAARLGVTGFCWGGAKTWLAAARFAEFKAGAAWYGAFKANPRYGATAAPLDVVKELKAPVLGLYGGKDQGIPLSDVEEMRAALKAAGKTDSQIVVYPDAQHGFLADYRPSYDPKAGADAWNRMLAFFASHGVR